MQCAGGTQRFESVRILEVLKPEQQREVRKRIAAWRTAAGKTAISVAASPGIGADSRAAVAPTRCPSTRKISP